MQEKLLIKLREQADQCGKAAQVLRLEKELDDTRSQVLKYLGSGRLTDIAAIRLGLGASAQGDFEMRESGRTDHDTRVRCWLGVAGSWEDS